MESFLFNIGLNNAAEGWTFPIMATICSVALIFWVSWWTESLWIFEKGHLKAKLRFWFSFFIAYPIVVTIQYLITFTIWFGMLQIFPDQYWVNAIIAFGFTLAHAPNWHLLWSSGFIMYFALNHMTIHHNIWPLILMHGMIATCWEQLTPKWILANSSTWLIKPGEYAKEQIQLNKKYNLVKRNKNDII